MADTDRHDGFDPRAPSEKGQQQRWSVGLRILAYAALAAVAIASIVYIDRGVMRTAADDAPAAEQP